jgi:hypothetical protein
VRFSDALHGIAVGQAGTIISTTDGGTNWITEETGVSTALNEICSPQPGFGVVVGNGGLILRHGSPYAAVSEVAQSPMSFSLAQNYPNPFNPSTRISFDLPAAGFVTLKVYDVLGNEVSSIVNGVLQGGAHEVYFDARGLSSGTYYYRLQMGSTIATKSLTLVK